MGSLRDLHKDTVIQNKVEKSIYKRPVNPTLAQSHVGGLRSFLIGVIECQICRWLEAGSSEHLWFRPRKIGYFVPEWLLFEIDERALEEMTREAFRNLANKGIITRISSPYRPYALTLPPDLTETQRNILSALRTEKCTLSSLIEVLKVIFKIKITRKQALFEIETLKNGGRIYEMREGNKEYYCFDY